jgi:hypothetical protein
MSKEQIINEVYLNYSKNHFKIWEPGMDYESKESFIRKCKTDPEFSETWGLTIEEREMSWEERRDLLTPSQYDGTALNKYGKEDCGFGDISPFTDKVIHYWLGLHNIPTKLITLTYNNETIESYE